MEGREEVPYDKDGGRGGGNCTVGVGHLLARGGCNPRNPDHTRRYSEAEIEKFYDEDLKKAEAIVIRTVNVSLNQNEFDALVMLAFNYPSFGSGGARRLVKALNAGRGSEGGSSGSQGWGRVFWQNEDSLRYEWADINKSKGQVVQGLVNRRSREIRLFFESVYFK
jgi:lysozyme